MIEQALQMLRAEPAIAVPFMFLFGLALGSFLNVCIVRFPKEESVIRGRSKCPQCGKMIAWYDNIPLVSFLVLRAKCRHCAKPISFQYPAIELLTAVCVTGLYFIYGFTIELLFYAYFAASLIVVIFVDFKHQIIPDEISIHGILVGLVLSYFFPEVQGETDKRFALANSSLGMLAGVGMIYGVALLGQFLFKKESMGGGDLKLLAMIGAFLGPQKAALTFFIAPLIGAPVGLILKFKHKEDVMAYGPYLAVASIAAWFWGGRIIGFLFPFY